MSKKGVVHGLKLEINNTQKPCTDCFQGKMHVQAFPTGRTWGKNLGALIHSDVNGPMEKMLPGQARYFVIFKDDYSGWCVVHFIRNKSEVPDLFRRFVAGFKTQYKAIVKVLQFDNRGVGRFGQALRARGCLRLVTKGTEEGQQMEIWLSKRSSSHHYNHPRSFRSPA